MASKKPKSSSASKPTPSQPESASSTNTSYTGIIKLVAYIAIALIVLGIAKCIFDILSKGPLPKAIANILGAGSSLIHGLSDGCVTQADCTKGTDSVSCLASNGCSWATPIKSGDAGTCINTTGRNTGDGGFASLSCGLGVGALLYLLGTFVAPALSWIIQRFTKTNPNVEAASELSGKPESQVLKETVEEAYDVAYKTKAALEKDGSALSPSEETLVGELAASESAKSQVQIAVEGNSQMSQSERAAAMNSAVEINATATQKSIDDATSNGVSEDSANEIDDETSRQVEGTGAESLISTIDRFAQTGYIPSRPTARLLLRRLERRNIQISDSNHAHIMYIKNIHNI